MKRVILIFIALFSITHKVSSYRNGLIYARSYGTKTEWTDHFCIHFARYFNYFKHRDISDANVNNLEDYSSRYDGCIKSKPLPQDKEFKNKVLALADGNCSFSEKALSVQKYGAVGILLVKDEIREMDITEYQTSDDVQIFIGIIKSSDFRKIQGMGPSVEVAFVIPKIFLFDWSYILVILIACLSVLLGGYWTGGAKPSETHDANNPEPRGSTQSTKLTTDHRAVDNVICFSMFFFNFCSNLKFILLITIFAIFYLDYYVILFVCIYCIIGACALFSCIHHLLSLIPCPRRTPCIKLKKIYPYLRNITVMCLCLGLSVFWGMQRNKSFIWWIQDIFLLALCVRLIKALKPNNVKDYVCFEIPFIVMVHILWYCFEGDMNEVTRISRGFIGADSTAEMLPFLFLIPRVQDVPLSVCSLPLTSLGVFEITAPGILIAQYYKVDLKNGGKPVYFIISLSAYAVGLLMSFSVMLLTDKMQISAQYSIPLIFLTTFVNGWRRKELCYLWTGNKNNLPLRPNTDIEEMTEMNPLQDINESSADERTEVKTI